MERVAPGESQGCCGLGLYGDMTGREGRPEGLAPGARFRSDS